MKNRMFWIVFWEMLLIIGSIPVFRSVWMLFDKTGYFNTLPGIIASFVVGLIVCVGGLYYLNEQAKNK